MRLDRLPAPRVRGAPLTPSTTSAAPATVRASPLEALVPSRSTPHGPLHLVERPLGPAPQLCAEALAALSLGDAPLDVRAPLFFDTETTGLAGGTGTLPFLVGIAEWRDGQAWSAQAHLPAPGHERPLLRWLAERIEAATVLVSFNGKSFDWPLLRTRFVMNRVPLPPERPHVDLLHCSRRVFRHQLDEVRLQTLERRVLDHHRQGDIDGALIPAAWFDYLRTGRIGVLARVLEHNARDVHSMVLLTERLLAAWEERHPLLPATAVGLATVAARVGANDKALRLLATAATTHARWTPMAALLHARLLRARGETRQAVEVLRAALPAAPQPALLHLHLARLLERDLRDPAAALAHARLARDAEAADLHARRIARLERRCDLGGSPP